LLASPGMGEQWRERPRTHAARRGSRIDCTPEVPNFGTLRHVSGRPDFAAGAVAVLLGEASNGAPFATPMLGNSRMGRAGTLALTFFEETS
jgi:hypothetical protein